jgi:membrane associated rhomboid family serine protease
VPARLLLARTFSAPLILRMFGVTTSDDYKPVTWMGRLPVDVTTILVATHVIVAVIGAILVTTEVGWILNLLIFDSARIFYGAQLWRLATYAFVHPPGSLLWFAIEMYMLFVFGREVERYIGQRPFVVLYGLLLLLPTAILTFWGLWQRTGVGGSPALHFGIFIAFATVYPSAELFLRITAKWTALILAAIYTLQLLAYHAWSDLVVVWTSIAAAWIFVRARGVGPELMWWSNLKNAFQPKPKFHVVPKSSSRRVVEPDDVYSSIDPILEKIARSGINSLSASERRALDRARSRLLNESK